MGGDAGISVTLPASFEFLKMHPEVHLVLVGDETQIAAHMLYKQLLATGRVKVVHASQVIAMDESPAIAMRTKRDSSMRVAIEQVKSGAAQACLSAGNTGALMAVARYVLKTLPGIERPAIAAQIPNQKGGATIMLDLGANVDCEAEHLMQFAIMGAALANSLKDIENPSIGLLNIGEEVIKGNDVVKQAAELLRASSLNFYGNVEGNDVYKGTTDVVVCDGFVGNIALKTSEGVASMLGQFIKEEFSRDFVSRLSAAIAMPVLKRFKNRADHRRYNGAALIGLRGIVFKSHGSADAFAFCTALQRVNDAISHDLIGQITRSMPELKSAALH